MINNSVNSQDQGPPVVENLPVRARGERDVASSLGRDDALEEGTATHSGVPAWRAPRTEGPGGYSP